MRPRPAQKVKAKAKGKRRSRDSSLSPWLTARSAEYQNQSTVAKEQLSMRWNPLPLRRNRSAARRHPPRKTYRPSIEEMEPRTLPSVNVLTYHNDNSDTGQNLNETLLTPANVNSSSFGKFFSVGVDGQVYAEPLYASGVSITVGANHGVHNVVFVATEHDSVYAIEADTGAVLWQDSFINPS